MSSPHLGSQVNDMKKILQIQDGAGQVDVANPSVSRFFQEHYDMLCQLYMVMMRWKDKRFSTPKTTYTVLLSTLRRKFPTTSIENINICWRAIKRHMRVSGTYDLVALLKRREIQCNAYKDVVKHALASSQDDKTTTTSIQAHAQNIQQIDTAIEQHINTFDSWSKFKDTFVTLAPDVDVKQQLETKTREIAELQRQHDATLSEIRRELKACEDKLHDAVTPSADNAMYTGESPHKTPSRPQALSQINSPSSPRDRSDVKSTVLQDRASRQDLHTHIVTELNKKKPPSVEDFKVDKFAWAQINSKRFHHITLSKVIDDATVYCGGFIYNTVARKKKTPEVLMCYEIQWIVRVDDCDINIVKEVEQYIWRQESNGEPIRIILVPIEYKINSTSVPSKKVVELYARNGYVLTTGSIAEKEVIQRYKALPNILENADFTLDLQTSYRGIDATPYMSKTIEV